MREGRAVRVRQAVHIKGMFMNQYAGMSQQERDIYSVARFVHLPCARLDAFLKVLAMCGYEIREKHPSDIDSEGR